MSDIGITHLDPKAFTDQDLPGAIRECEAAIARIQSSIESHKRNIQQDEKRQAFWREELATYKVEQKRREEANRA